MAHDASAGLWRTGTNKPSMSDGISIEMRRYLMRHSSMASGMLRDFIRAAAQYEGEFGCRALSAATARHPSPPASWPLLSAEYGDSVASRAAMALVDSVLMAPTGAAVMK